MNFLKESGAIVDPNGNILHLVEGEAGSVTFPDRLIWQLHKLQPGIVNRLAHVHPPYFGELSQMDKDLMKGWAFALFPFPIRLTVITQKSEKEVVENVYLGLLDHKMGNFRIIRELYKYYNFYSYEWYGKQLLNISYERFKNSDRVTTSTGGSRETKAESPTRSLKTTSHN